MSLPSPSFLRLPRAALAKRNVVSTLVSAQPSARGHARAAAWHAFAFKDDELLFARSLLALHSCFWLYRTHQRAFAGDFVVVDLSSPVVARRPVAAIDLKRGEPVRIHEGHGVQLRNAPRVVEEIAATGVVDAARRPCLLTGSAAAVLRFLVDGGLTARRPAACGTSGSSAPAAAGTSSEARDRG